MLSYPLKHREHTNISQTLRCFHPFRNLPPSQKLWKKSSKSSKSIPTRILRTWTSVTSPKTHHQPQHPPPPPHPPPKNNTSYNHHTNHSTRSPFLHTTQLQTNTSPKSRIQLQNHNFKVHQPNTHNLTNCHNHTIHSHTEM